MNPNGRPPALVRWTRRLEDATALDAPVHALEPHDPGLVRNRDARLGAAGRLAGPRGPPGADRRRDRHLDLRQCARPVRGARLVRRGPAAHRHRSARRRSDGVDRLGGVVGSRVAREAGRPRPRRHQRPRDRHLRGVVGRPSAGPARRREPGWPWPERPSRGSAPTWAATSRGHARWAATTPPTRDDGLVPGQPRYFSQGPVIASVMPGRLDVDEQHLAVGGEGRSGELGVLRLAPPCRCSAGCARSRTSGRRARS